MNVILNMFLNVGLLLDGNWYDIIGTAVDKFIGPILIILCSIGIIYAVVVGVKMIKAEDKTAREENKARLINIAISIVAVVALIALFYALRAWIGNNESTVNSGFGIDSNSQTQTPSGTRIGSYLNILKFMVRKY